MPTLQDIANDALSSLNSSAGFLSALTWANNRYKQLARKARLNAQRKVGTLELPAEINTGTITTTRGSDVVTGNAAAQAVWDQTLIGRHIRTDVTWYEITNVTGDKELRITPAWGEDAVSAGAYEIIKRFHALPRQCRWLGIFVHQRLRKRFYLTSPEALDRLAPDRHFISDGPTSGAETGVDQDGAKVVELYPYNEDIEVVHFEYWEIPDKLRPHDHLPSFLDPDVLKEGVLVDVMRWEMQQAQRAGNVEGAALWRNDYRAQETRWARMMEEGVSADRGDRNTTVVLRKPHLARGDDVDDVKTAEANQWLFGDELLR